MSEVLYTATATTMGGLEGRVQSIGRSCYWL